MGNFLVRPVRADDVIEVTALLNAVIARGGTTAFETPFEPDALAEHYLLGPKVISTCVARDDVAGRLEGFQLLVRSTALPAGWGDIGTFARVDGAQRGVGRALFEHTKAAARDRGCDVINATIRADNSGGLRYYEKMGFRDYAVEKALPLLSGVRVDRIMKRYPPA